MAGSLLSAAFIICVYMVAVGYLLINNDSSRWQTGNLTPLFILSPIVFLVFSRLIEPGRRREVEQMVGRRMLIGGTGCGIATLVVAAVSPQVPGGVIMFVVAWGTLFFILLSARKIR